MGQACKMSTSNYANAQINLLSCGENHIICIAFEDFKKSSNDLE